MGGRASEKAGTWAQDPENWVLLSPAWARRRTQRPREQPADTLTAACETLSVISSHLLCDDHDTAIDNRCIKWLNEGTVPVERGVFYFLPPQVGLPLDDKLTETIHTKLYLTLISVAQKLFLEVNMLRRRVIIILFLFQRLLLKGNLLARPCLQWEPISQAPQASGNLRRAHGGHQPPSGCGLGLNTCAFPPWVLLSQAGRVAVRLETKTHILSYLFIAKQTYHMSSEPGKF